MTTDAAARFDGGFADVLVGLQYGDEGKAKIVDHLAPGYDIVARFNGGANAGHTVDAPSGAVVLQQVPSAVLHPHALLYIGSGCAVNLWKLRDELEMLASIGVDLDGRLAISDRCALIQPAHFIVDEVNAATIGTTKNGIGPCYADRAARMHDGERVNFQLRDLVANPAGCTAAMRRAAEAELVRSGATGTDLQAAVHARLAALPECIDAVRGFVQSDRDYLGARVAQGARVLFEGAQSVMLDVVHGDQPFVTSSHTLPAYAYVGGDLSPRHHRRTFGVAKAVVSRVGNGPFPSELGGDQAAQYFAAACREGRGAAEEDAMFDSEALLASSDPMELGIALRMLTHEYGSGTGRPRRIGILDLDQLAEVVSAFDVDFVYINKVDCLALYAKSVYSGIPVRASRAAGGNGSDVTVLPPLTFEADHGDVDPSGLLEFASFVERQIGVRVAGLGLGPEREHITQFVDVAAGV